MQSFSHIAIIVKFGLSLISICALTAKAYTSNTAFSVSLSIYSASSKLRHLDQSVDVAVKAHTRRTCNLTRLDYSISCLDTEHTIQFARTQSTREGGRSSPHITSGRAIQGSHYQPEEPNTIHPIARVIAILLIRSPKQNLKEEKTIIPLLDRQSDCPFQRRFPNLKKKSVA